MSWIIEVATAAVAVIGELRHSMVAARRASGRRELRVVLRLYKSILKLVECDIEAPDTFAACDGPMSDFVQALRDVDYLALGIYSPDLQARLQDAVFGDLQQLVGIRAALARVPGFSDIPESLMSSVELLEGLLRGRRAPEAECASESLPAVLEQCRLALAEFIREHWTYEELLAAK
jgi:hypothetical protein